MTGNVNVMCFRISFRYSNWAIY